MTSYIENTKDATRKLLELIDEFGKVVGYRINTHKYLTFLYTKNKDQKEKLRSSPCGTAETNPTGVHGDADSIPGLTQWVGDLLLL